MTVKELFKKVDKEVVASYYITDCLRSIIDVETSADKFSIPQIKELIISLLTDLEKINEQVSEKDILFITPCFDMGLHAYPDVFTVEKQDLADLDKFFNTYCFDLCPVEEILGYQLAESVFLLDMTEAEIAATILHELTNFGMLSVDEINQNKLKFKQRLEKALNDKPENLKSLDEVFDELEEKYPELAEEEPSEEFKLKQNEVINLMGNFNKDLTHKQFEYEQKIRLGENKEISKC